MQRAAQEFAAHNQNEFFLYQQSILSVCWDDSRLPLPAGPPPPTYKRVKRKKHSGNIRIYVSAFCILKLKFGKLFSRLGKGNQSDEVVRNRKKLFYFSLTFRLVLNNNDYTF
jgi:hypothetical protein